MEDTFRRGSSELLVLFPALSRCAFVVVVIVKEESIALGQVQTEKKECASVKMMLVS